MASRPRITGTARTAERDLPSDRGAVKENRRVRYSILGTTQALHDDGTAVVIGGRGCAPC